MPRTAPCFVYLLSIVANFVVVCAQSNPTLWSRCARGGEIAYCDEWYTGSQGGEGINDRESGTGQTPLMAACLAGKAEVVDFLLSKGADYTIGEKDGYFPHDGAGFQGRPAVTSVLLKHNISPDYVHRDGYPPIFRAAWGRTDNHAEVIRILIDEGGVSPTITDARGISLLDVASRTGIEKTVEVVQKAIASQKGSPKNEL